MITTIKGLRIRLFPTAEQEQGFYRHIGACRFIWNHMLATQERRYKDGEKHLSAFDMNKQITQLKQAEQFSWLGEVATASLYRACADLSTAYDRFFKKLAEHPKFKKRKRSKIKFSVRDNAGAMYFNEESVHIPKIGKVKYKTNYKIPLGRDKKFSNPRIELVGKKWILSLGIECENQAPVLTDKTMGIDLGIKDLAVVSFDGEQIKFGNINKSKRMRTLEKKQKHIQRAISRKYRINGKYARTKNIDKYEAILRKIKSKLSNKRQDYTHKTTHTLVELLPKRVTMEDLNVSGMMKNHHLAKAIQDQKLAEFIRQMKYKCKWRGIEFIQADRWYPSSKTCSCCGNVKKELKLKDRTFVCPVCGFTIDRDFNAAKNLEAYEPIVERLVA